MPAASLPLLRTAPPGVVTCDVRQVSGHPGVCSGLGRPEGLGAAPPGVVTCDGRQVSGHPGACSGLGHPEGLGAAPPGVVTCDGRQVSGHPGACSGLGHPEGLGVNLVTLLVSSASAPQKAPFEKSPFEKSLWLSRRSPPLRGLRCTAPCVFFTKHTTPPSLLNSVLFISSR